MGRHKYAQCQLCLKAIAHWASTLSVHMSNNALRHLHTEEIKFQLKVCVHWATISQGICTLRKPCPKAFTCIYWASNVPRQTYIEHAMSKGICTLSMHCLKAYAHLASNGSGIYTLSRQGPRAWVYWASGVTRHVYTCRHLISQDIHKLNARCLKAYAHWKYMHTSQTMIAKSFL